MSIPIYAGSTRVWKAVPNVNLHIIKVIFYFKKNTQIWSTLTKMEKGLLVVAKYWFLYKFEYR